ncbi:ChbG/HpnK family deacetylase [Amphibiibacter pelophylacis]|uniref:ChbG/HpnK family deacetylase n=1 Tax=Amphibiibacter pelophylacis TaxID=1799477 RepID=A0ACC6P2R5_9BURK
MSNPTRPRPERTFILCADDYAHDAGVSAGILALGDQRRLTATSAMVLSPRWAQDAAPLRERRGLLDVGLHLDWTSPFAQEAGHGMGLGALMLRSLSHTLPGRLRLQGLIARQLDAFEQHWQAVPDHIDGHQHVHQFPGLRQALLAELQRRYGDRPQRPWLRVSRQNATERDLKGRIIAAMGAQALLHFAQEQAWPHAPWLSGVYGFDGDAATYRAHMQRWLAALQPGTVLMCHPAQAVSGPLEPAAAQDGIAAARRAEFSYLSSPALARDLDQAGARPVRMGQMERHG